MSKVIYKGFTVSDDDIKKVLTKISKYIGTVSVTSGDRIKGRKNSSKTSLHLKKQAVDFGIYGVTLEEGFQKIMLKRNLIFSKNCRYEVIWHGKYTFTGGPHLHIGRYPKGTGITFKKEGVTLEEKGKYSFLV